MELFSNNDAVRRQLAANNTAKSRPVNDRDVQKAMHGHQTDSSFRRQVLPDVAPVPGIIHDTTGMVQEASGIRKRAEVLQPPPRPVAPSVAHPPQNSLPVINSGNPAKDSFKNVAISHDFETRSDIPTISGIWHAGADSDVASRRDYYTSAMTGEFKVSELSGDALDLNATRTNLITSGDEVIGDSTREVMKVADSLTPQEKIASYVQNTMEHFRKNGGVPEAAAELQKAARALQNGEYIFGNESEKASEKALHVSGFVPNVKDMIHKALDEVEPKTSKEWDFIKFVRESLPEATPQERALVMYSQAKAKGPAVLAHLEEFSHELQKTIQLPFSDISEKGAEFAKQLSGIIEHPELVQIFKRIR